ncbi:hypothetical protein YYC_02031 [Plasmodium yoelii 17X]|uniref:Uncharacterized protein n=1 Tax=Plasmodium yoelii 17X TaxID=1323249 RepID=V7PNF6_PLAYE|nr:hypothetical protein YYC_02031 [Plasmodium yoelii 17X]
MNVKNSGIMSLVIKAMKQSIVNNKLCVTDKCEKNNTKVLAKLLRNYFGMVNIGTKIKKDINIKCIEIINVHTN